MLVENRNWRLHRLIRQMSGGAEASGLKEKRLALLGVDDINIFKGVNFSHGVHAQESIQIGRDC